MALGVGRYLSTEVLKVQSRAKSLSELQSVKWIDAVDFYAFCKAVDSRYGKRSSKSPNALSNRALHYIKSTIVEMRDRYIAD